MSLEFKTFEFEVKDVNDSGAIQGYASTFGNVDLGLDVVVKGAFKKTLQENGGKFPILADHNPSDQIGWNISAIEDSKGLLVDGMIDLNVQKGREKYSLAKKALEIGAKMGLSIGYMTIKAEPDPKQPQIRYLKELKLFEYSLVTFPMNTMADVTGIKALDEKINHWLKMTGDYGLTTEQIKEALLKGDSESLEQASILASLKKLNGTFKKAADLSMDPVALDQSMKDLIKLIKTT